MKTLYRILGVHPALIRTAARLAVWGAIRPSLRRLGVPIVAVTGSSGKTSTVRLLSRMFTAMGYSVGASCTEGVLHNDRLVRRGDQSGGGGAWRAARCPGVELLVLESARGGMLTHGPAFGECDVAVVTNVSDDHLGYHGVNTTSEMAAVKGAVPSRAKESGAAILNADDPLVRTMAEGTKARVVWFTVDGRQEQFDPCFYFEKGGLWRRTGEERRFLAEAGEFPITIWGKRRCQVANLLAALAAMEALKGRLTVKEAPALASLREFGRNPADAPGRFTLHRYRGRYLLLCHSKNPASLREDGALIRLLREWYGFDTLVGILTSTGRKNAALYRSLSREAAPLCDLFFVRPPKAHFAMDHTPEEMVELLSSAIPPEKIAGREPCSLDEILDGTGKVAPEGTLYVVFNASAEEGLDLDAFQEASESVPISFD